MESLSTVFFFFKYSALERKNNGYKSLYWICFRPHLSNRVISTLVDTGEWNDRMLGSKLTNNLLPPPPLLKIWKVMCLKPMSFLLWFLVYRKCGKVEGGVVEVFVFPDPPQEQGHRLFMSWQRLLFLSDSIFLQGPLLFRWNHSFLLGKKMVTVFP